MSSYATFKNTFFFDVLERLNIVNISEAVSYTHLTLPTN